MINLDIDTEDDQVGQTLDSIMAHHEALTKQVNRLAAVTRVRNRSFNRPVGLVDAEIMHGLLTAEKCLREALRCTDIHLEQLELMQLQWCTAEAEWRINFPMERVYGPPS